MPSARKSPDRAVIPVISYRRVSTSKQGVSGVGLEEQLAAIWTYCDQSGFSIIGDYHDVASGRGPNNLRKRPGLQKALSEAKRLGTRIVVSGMDRISRDSQSVQEFACHGVRIDCTNLDDPTNPIVINSEAAKAEARGRAISERTSAALQERKAKGIKLGNPTNLPEAQKLGSAKLQKQATELRKRIRDVLREFEVSPSLREMADILNDRGIFTGRGGRWTSAALKRPFRDAKALLDAECDEARQAEIVEEVGPEHDAAVIYKDHPLFGRF